jgi:hypothetical protein
VEKTADAAKYPTYDLGRLEDGKIVPMGNGYLSKWLVAYAGSIF